MLSKFSVNLIRLFASFWLHYSKFLKVDISICTDGTKFTSNCATQRNIFIWRVISQFSLQIICRVKASQKDIIHDGPSNLDETEDSTG